MDLPPSSLLGRLQAFLPEMEKANKATEELAAEGNLDVLDSTLEVMTGPPETQENLSDETDGEEDEEIRERVGSEPGVQGVANDQTIQLDFALGDFDETPIARMEQEMENTKDTQVQTSVNHTANERGEDGEDSQNVADTVQPRDEDSSQQQQGRSKPLVEEL